MTVATFEEYARRAYRSVRAQALQPLLATLRHGLPLRAGASIEVVGHFHEATGLGESARLCAVALSESGRRVALRDVSRRHELPFPLAETLPADPHPDCRIWHLNPPLLPPAALQLGLKAFHGSFNIGYWAWELDRLPPEWIRATRAMDAIFAPSRFTAEVIAEHAPCPVQVVPHPIALTQAPQGLRGRLDLPTDAFVTALVFNCDSSFERKNPLAAIAAFHAALGEEEDAFLILKTNRLRAAPESLARLADAIAGHPRIRIEGELWPAEEIAMVLGEADAYLSLHRSEGFGLTIAEALLRGTPVVATAYSGNTDLAPPQLYYPVPATQVAVADPHPDFRALAGTAHWAEPDVAAASAQLRRIYDDRASAKARGQAARHYLATYLGHQTYAHALHQLEAAGVIARGVHEPDAPRRGR
ncbi:MAG: glycosyltransferase family 4 protein [Zoogloeaceae bacterium]|nr:glycosyltransferase family 4 protein [Zoogloeaceae bacterium]